jgi:hypothetical protein
MKFPKKVEFENVRRAIEQAGAYEGGVAVRMDGKNYVMHQDYADQLIARGKTLAYLAIHANKIVSIPANNN